MEDTVAFANYPYMSSVCNHTQYKILDTPKNNYSYIFSQKTTDNF